MSGLIGRKIGMTSIFDENGKNIPCTVIEAGPCVVTQVRTKGVDGYEALQLGFDDKGEKHSTKAAVGHFKKAGTVAKKKVVEFQGFATEQKLGDVIDVTIFEEGEFVDVQGVSKGKGFQGVIKRHGFAGGPAAHGSQFHRRSGSIGNRATPGRVFAGKKMPGHMGAERVTTHGVTVFKVDLENNCVLVKGSVPGAQGSFIEINF